MIVFEKIIPLIVTTIPLLEQFLYLILAAAFIAAVPDLIRRFL